MTRMEMLEVVRELLDVVNSKRVSLQDAKSIAYIFQKSVEENNEIEVNAYIKTGTFYGSPPKT